METKKLVVNYYRQGDTLWLHIHPDRPAREEMTEYDFYIRYDRDTPNEIVGFKVLDFSHFAVHLYEQGVVPVLPWRFSVEGTEVRDVTLQGVLEWSYRHYILGEKTADMEMFVPSSSLSLEYAPSSQTSLPLREEPGEGYKTSNDS